MMSSRSTALPVNVPASVKEHQHDWMTGEMTLNDTRPKCTLLNANVTEMHVEMVVRRLVVHIHSDRGRRHLELVLNRFQALVTGHVTAHFR